MAEGRRPVTVIVLLAVACFLPLLAASLLNLLASSWRPWATSNHGTLVSPPREMRAGELSALDGQEIGERFFRGKWTLVVLDEPPCDPLCREQLVKMRQVRLALGKDAMRVQRLLVTRATPGNVDYQRLAAEFSGTRMASPSARWLEPFELYEGEPGHPARIHVIDPIGLLMMYYPPDIDPSLMLKDMQRLLRASRIG